MDANENIKQFAYFREFTHSNQYELFFNIDTEVPPLGVFKEEIKAVRATTDTVSSLFQHIKNKILKILKDKYAKDEDNNELSETIKIPISFNIDLLMNENRSLKVLHNFLLKNQCTIFKIFDQEYNVLANAPLIKQIKLPPVIYVESCIKPFKYSTIFTDNQKSTFIWYKSKDKSKWVEIDRGFRYTIKDEDIGYYLKLLCEPINKHGICGPSAEAVSDDVVEIMGNLPTCPFESRHQYTKEKLVDDDELRVVSYNILAEKYTMMDSNYTYCEPKYLVMDYRKQLIWKELRGYNADVICLQEVDDYIYTDYLRGLFKADGYFSFYYKKGNYIPEGLATMYDTKKLTHLEETHIVYGAEIRKSMYGHIWDILVKNPVVRHLFDKQFTSLQVTVLKVKKTNKILIVGNTHLYYHPSADHIRLLQVAVANTCLNNFKKRYQKPNVDVTVIFCGDFNSSHGKSLYPFMIKGTINPDHKDCRAINYKGRALLYHELNFESSCGQPPYTNYTPTYKGCLDYIFIERRKLFVNKVVPLPSEEELAKHEGLPNKLYPSDHLPLVVDLKFKL